jgi:hypothetical protein
MENMAKDIFPMKEKLAALDMKATGAWSEMSDEEKKSVTADLWILNRWMSSVGDMNWKTKTVRDTPDTAEAVIFVNENYNKNWNIVSKHPELQWKLLCTTFEKAKVRNHNWIPMAKKSSANKNVKIILEIYPNIKLDEAEYLARILTAEELKEFEDYLKDAGKLEKPKK